MPQALTLIDLAFLALESRVQTGHVGGLLIFTLPAHAQEGFFRQAVESHADWRRVDGIYGFKLHRQGLRPCWVTDDTVDIEAHIQYLALPKPGTRLQLYAVVERLHAQPLDHHHPLWEIAFIEGLEGGRGAVYIKVHHALVDGISAIRTLLRTFSTTPDTPSPLLFWQPPAAPERPSSDDEVDSTQQRDLSRAGCYAGIEAASVTRTRTTSECCQISIYGPTQYPQPSDYQSAAACFPRVFVTSSDLCRASGRKHNE